MLIELNRRKDELFTCRDSDFKRISPDVNPNTINWILGRLSESGLIDKLNAEGHRKQYFGSHAAIKEPKRQLSV